ncbi:MAG: hypothetical protein BroJett040_04790 [Oligoflexia bacterium]|nr:MAG: hypothetical protein BroJett040_04790 [Oligoflexia bacterium]
MHNLYGHFTRTAVFGLFLFAIVFFNSLANASALQCAKIFRVEYNIQANLTQLAELRMRLDSELGRGARSLITTAMEKDFEKKYKELLQHVTGQNLMSEAELNQKLVQAISKVQTVVEKDNKNEDQARQDQTNKIQERIRVTDTVERNIQELGKLKAFITMLRETGQPNPTGMLEPYNQMLKETLELAEIHGLMSADEVQRQIDQLEKVNAQNWFNN